MRLVLADDHAIMRQGLRAQFERRGIAEVVGEADNGETVVELVRTLSPDAVIMDITMPRLNGIEAIRCIQGFDPAIKLIVLSMHAEQCLVIEALKAGCHAYVLKSSDFAEIQAALEAVAQDERYLSPEITGVVIDEFLHHNHPSNGRGINELSSRERQILQMTAEGLSVKDIANALDLSPKTADATRRNIMQKMDEHTIAGLTKLAIREGLTSLEF